MEDYKIISYKDLIVWQKAMNVVEHVYKLTEAFPSKEIYGLVSQMRRCSVSIPSNIAEGKARGTKKDYRSFLIRAFASGAELETQLEISQRLKYIGEYDVHNYETITSLLDEVMRMLNAIIRKLNT